MNLKAKIGAVLLAIAALFGGTYTAGQFGAVGNVRGVVATSTFQTVTANTVRLLFATSSNCVSRAISTQGGAIKLTFTDFNGQRPTAVRGFQQSASTTVVYDAQQFGCDAIYVYPYGTDTLTVQETR